MKSKDQQLLEEAYELILLNESGDSIPYHSEWSEEDQGYVFHPDPNNTQEKYVVLLTEDPGYRKRLVIMFLYSNPAVGIESTAEMTGTGRARKVLATVAKIVKEYLDVHSDKYEIVTFDAKSTDRSRVALYTRLAPKLKNIIGSNWDLNIFRSKTDVTFELSKQHG